MKNQLLFLAFFALLFISKTQSVAEAIIAVLTNEEALFVTNEEGVISPQFPNTVINTTKTAGPTLTIQAPPIPQNLTVSADQAVSDLSDVISNLNGLSGVVLITNADGTVSIVDASDLASDLSDLASDLSDAGGQVVVANGGNIQYVSLDNLAN